MKSLATASLQTCVPQQAMLLIEMIIVLRSGLKSGSLATFGAVQFEYFDLVGTRIEVFIPVVTFILIGRVSTWSFAILSIWF